jgi:Protein of unknown function (DUF2281)
MIMLATIKGVYQNGQIRLDELPDTLDDMEVFVTFTKTITSTTLSLPKPKRIFGIGKGSITYMSADFDEPLDDLKDYM